MAYIKEFGLNKEYCHPSKRLKAAQRWQWVATVACGLFFLTCFLGWPFGYLWPSAVSLLAFLPSVWIFSTKCNNCGWLAFCDYKTEEKLRNDQRFWTRFWGKDYGGVSLPLPSSCTKCDVSFFQSEPNKFTD